MAEYLPKGEEYERRLEWLRWLRDHGWDDGFIDAVMRQDSPSIDLVERVVNRFGEEEAKMILMEWYGGSGT